jgi:hypothetical protein
MSFVVERDFVEYKKFGFRPEVDDIAETGELQIVLRSLRNCAGIKPVTVSCYRVKDARDQAKRGRLHERINPVA